MLKSLLELNEKLKAIEERILFKCKELDAKLSYELSLKQGDIEDYELELVVSFYHQDFDNPIYEHSENMKYIVTKSRYRFIGSKEKYFHYPKNDFQSRYDCCGLFYRLYEDSSIKDILSVETIWWDIMPMYQYKISFEPVF